MNVNALIEKASGMKNHLMFLAKKHSPEILLGGGLALMGIGTAKACKATVKAQPVITNAKLDLEDIRNAIDQNEISAEDGRKEITKIYLKTGKDVVALYTPAFVTSAAGVTGILASHNVMSNRNAALATAYAAIDSSFKQYRTRVLDRYGEQAETEIRSGARPVEIEETVTDAKGKEKKVKKTVMVVDENSFSDFARIIKRGSPCWVDNESYMDMFIRSQENIAQNKLIANRYLFLNDVYEALGLERTVAGQQVGWIYDPSDMDSDRDNYVRFRTHLVNVETENGIETGIMIDFNVDGLILAEVSAKKILAK